VLQTRVTFKREAVKYNRVSPGIMHGIDNFCKHRVTGDVPSLKRYIYERSPTTALGMGLHGAAKNAYRIGSLPGKAAWGAGLAGETLLLKAGAVAGRQAGMAVYQKLRNSGDNDTGRLLAKAVSGAGALLIMRRETLMVRKELPLLKKRLAASERRLKKFVPPLLDLYKRQLKNARRSGNKAAVKRLKAKIRNTVPSSRYKAQIKNYKKTAAKSKKSVTKLINKKRAALVKHTSKLEKQSLRFAKKLHRENKRLLKIAKRGKFSAALGLAGRKFAEKIGAAARENDTTAVVGAAVSIAQQLRKTKMQKLYAKKKKISKLKRKDRLRRKNSKLHKKGAGAKMKGKKRRKKPKKGLKSKLAAIISALSNPVEAIKNLLKSAISKAVFAIILPALPFLLIGFVVVVLIISTLPTVATFMVSSYPSEDSEMLAAEQRMTELEVGLQEQISILMSSPGYDEHQYNFYFSGETADSSESSSGIGHGAHALMAYLSAKYGGFEYGQVQGEISAIYGSMYYVETYETVERRTSSYYDSDGELRTSYYDYKILVVNLYKTGFGSYVIGGLDTDKYDWYLMYKETKGNRPDLFN